MNRRSRGSWLLNSNQGTSGEGLYTELCKKELQRHYDSTVAYTGPIQDGDLLHDSCVGISGIMVYRPVFKMESGEKVKGDVKLNMSSLLHEFCKGKIYLMKLLLPHHPEAREDLGSKFDQISPSTYVKTAAFLIRILGNINMADDVGKTPLEYLLVQLANPGNCATHWVPVLQLMLQSGASLGGTHKQNSALDLMLKLAEFGFKQKSCGDDCEKTLIKFLCTEAEIIQLDAADLWDIFQDKNKFIADQLENMKTSS